MDFQLYPHSQHLSPPNSLKCLELVYTWLLKHLRDEGNVPLPIGTEQFAAGDDDSNQVVLGFFTPPLPAQDRLTYNDMIQVLGALAKKLRREGYREWEGIVFKATGAVGVIRLEWPGFK